MNPDLERRIDALLEKLSGSYLEELFAEVESYPLPTFFRIEVDPTATTMVVEAQPSNDFEASSMPLPPVGQDSVICQGTVYMELPAPVWPLAVTGRSEELPWAA